MSEVNNTSSRSINVQVIDVIGQVNNFLKEGGFAIEGISNQLANQQQQLFTLQNVVTTAVAKSMLHPSPKEAMQLINVVIKENNITV